MVKGSRSKHTSILKEIFSFPEVINEYAARIVAAGVVLITITYFYTNNIYFLYFLIYGFIARVFTGPSLSPIGQIATRIIIPLIGNPYKKCPGISKQFAQIIGLLFSSSSLLLIIMNKIEEANVMLIILLFFACMEAFMGFCAACWLFKIMIKWQLLPNKICKKCNELSLKI